jgi:transcriptional regulator with XRE-family HTH domain
MEPIDRINHVLALRGMTGAELTRTLGLSTAVYSQWNTKSTKPSKKNLIRVAEVLEVDPEYLISGDEKKPAPEGELSEERREVLSMIDGMSNKELIRLKQLIKIAKEGL